MRRIVDITDEPIDATRVIDAVASTSAGAVVLFLGTVRELTGGRSTVLLEYEAFAPMARHQLDLLCDAATDRWPIVACCVVHRVGRLEPGDAAVAVAVSTAHRADAFEAARWLMDAIKRDVPIWKKEHYQDGVVEWVGPAESPGGGGL